MKYKREAESDVIESRAQITTEPMAFNRDPALSRSGANSFLYRLHKHYGNRHLQKILASYAKGPAAPKADYFLQAGTPASVNLQRDTDSFPSRLRASRERGVGAPPPNKEDRGGQ